MMTQNNSPSTFQNFNRQEHDACGIVACLEKRKIPTRENIMSCIDALVTMNHRAGFINGEGDGVGIHIDIPRNLWKEKLQKAGLNPQDAEKDHFVVGHIFITRTKDAETIKSSLIKKMEDSQFTVLLHSDKVTNSAALGPIAIQENPIFLQFACTSNLSGQNLSKVLFNLTVELEQNNHVHVASLSQYHAVYKVMGAGDILSKYYDDLANPLVASAIT